MKVKKERIYCYPYEYKGLEEHLQAMAMHGWILNNIEDRGYYMILIYDACEPQTLYFYTDFCEDTSYFIYGVISDKAQEYVSFVESYGYHFVVGRKGLMVYLSDEQISIPLRDENEDTRKKLRKATYKNLIFPFLMMMISTISLISVYNFLIVKFSSWYLSDGVSLLRNIQFLIMFVLFFSMLLPAFCWRIRNKTKATFVTMRLRFHLIFIGLASWILTMGLQFNEQLFLIVVGFMMPVFLIAKIWDYIVTKKKYVQIAYVLIVFVMLVGMIQMLPVVIQKNVNNAYKDKPTLASSIFKIPNDVGYYVDRRSSIFLSSDETSYNFGDQGSISYEIFRVNDTFLKDYIMRNLPYEYEENVKKQREGNDIMYTSDQSVMVQRGNFFIRVNKAMCEHFDSTTWDTIFESVQAAYE